MLAAVKEEGLELLSGARAGRSPTAEEKGAEVQNKELERGPGRREPAFPVMPSGTVRPRLAWKPGHLLLAGVTLARRWPGAAPWFVPKSSSPAARHRWEGTVPGSAATFFLLVAVRVGQHPAPAKPPSRCRFPVQVQARGTWPIPAGGAAVVPPVPAALPGWGEGLKSAFLILLGERWLHLGAVRRGAGGDRRGMLLEGNRPPREAMGRGGKILQVGTGPFAKNKWRKSNTGVRGGNPCLGEISPAAGWQSLKAAAWGC